MIIRSIFFAILSIFLMYLARIVFTTNAYLADTGGLSAFASVFGTLYGIMIAFVVFEVWGQHNTTQHLVEKEAMELERLFRLTLYFRNNTVTKQMKSVIEKYAQLIITDKFRYLGARNRHDEEDKAFRKITHIIRNIRLNHSHDQIVFDQLIGHFGELSDLRTERINYSLLRLPRILKMFLYISSALALVIFIIMPFANMYYGFVATGTFAFLLAMIFQLIEDLDNPFVGYWVITPEPFERALRHIEEDY